MSAVVGMARHPNQNRGRPIDSGLDDSELLADFRAYRSAGYGPRAATTQVLDIHGYSGAYRDAARNRLLRKIKAGKTK